MINLIVLIVVLLLIYYVYRNFINIEGYCKNCNNHNNYHNNHHNKHNRYNRHNKYNHHDKYNRHDKYDRHDRYSDDYKFYKRRYISSLPYIHRYNNLYSVNLPLNYCDCSYKDSIDCSSCANCGYCVNENGYGECVVGNSNGPFFRRDCVVWDFNKWKLPNLFGWLF